MAPALVPSKTLRSGVTHLLSARQATVTVAPVENSDPSRSPDTGSIVGIVLGCVAGVLLLIWIWKSCIYDSKPKAWGDAPPPDQTLRRDRGRSASPRHGGHHHHHHHHQHSRSRSRRGSYDYRGTPVIVEKVPRSPQAPPPIYVAREERVRDPRRSSRRRSRDY